MSKGQCRNHSPTFRVKAAQIRRWPPYWPISLTNSKYGHDKHGKRSSKGWVTVSRRSNYHFLMGWDLHKSPQSRLSPWLGSGHR